MKPLLYTSLPAHVQRIIIMDMDLIFASDIKLLWDHFNLFPPDAVLGLVEESQPYYHLAKPFADFIKDLGSPHTFRGFNGGVQLQYLARIRKSLPFRRFLESTADQSPAGKHGAMPLMKGICAEWGDQDIYTWMFFFNPELFHRVGCEWNRMLSFGYNKRIPNGEDWYRCDVPKVHVYHSNHGQGKHGTNCVRFRTEKYVDCRPSPPREWLQQLGFPVNSSMMTFWTANG